MRKGFVLVFVVCLFMTMWTSTGCSDKKPVENDTVLSVDTFVDTVKVDTMSQLIAEQPMPKAADELFDDFIFNFAANNKLQLERIQFPLKVKNSEGESFLEESQWKMETFFMEQGYYTLIFDNLKQVEVVKDTTTNHVIVEKIDLKNEHVKKYVFERIHGNWMLTEIDKDAMFMDVNSSFLAFYRRFSTDPDFQLKSLNDPIIFNGPDPDDDFETMTGEIAPESWEAFAPELPTNIIYNIMYGQKYSEETQKVFVIRGIANGLEIQLVFKKINGDWKLTEQYE
ncbi:MAG: DUF4348 domain-containing protein [Prevotella sp.]|nr:DUF4348 domain-containing protein [Prevotella sp.]